MNDYVKKIKLFIKGEEKWKDLSDEEFLELKSLLLPNLKRCVLENNIDGFNILTDWFMGDLFENIDTLEHVYSNDICKYYYGLVQQERFEFMTEWGNREFGNISNLIIWEEINVTMNNMEEKFKLVSKKNIWDIKCAYMLLVFENYYQLFDKFDENLESNIKEKMNYYIFNSLLHIKLLESIITDNSVRQYLPNRIYTLEMFQYTDSLVDKGYSKKTTIEETLKKFKKPVEKFEPYRVQYGKYLRSPFKSITKYCEGE